MKYLTIFYTLLISCAGQDGTNGVNGLDGSPGKDGKNGYSCSVENTTEGALVTCEDGSQSFVEDGEDLTIVPTPAPNTCVEHTRCNRHGKCKTKRICLFQS